MKPPPRSFCLLSIFLLTRISPAGPVIGENPHTGEKIRLKTDHPVFAFLSPATLKPDESDKALRALLSATAKSLQDAKALSAFCSRYLALNSRKKLDNKEKRKLGDVLLAAVKQLSSAELKEPKLRAACFNGLALLRHEGFIKGKQFASLAIPAKAELFQDGKVRKGKLFLDLVDLLWDSPALSRDEQKALREAAYGGLSPGGGSCNNGRWGWVRSWKVAAAFSDAGLAAKVLDDFRHWLGHDVYPSGAPLDFVSYDYCHARKPAVLDDLAGIFDGLDPVTYKVPSFPTADRFHRDGVADARNLKKVESIYWRDISLFRDRYRNMAMPNGTVPGINDTNPLAAEDATRRRLSVDSPASRNAGSSALLYSGSANRAFLWGEAEAEGNTPETTKDVFAAYLHADPSDAVHNHYDINQLILWRYGKMLAGDNGGSVNVLTKTYDRKLGAYGMKTYSHNTVVVDQKSQFIGGGKILDFGELPGFKVATADAGYAWKNINHRRLLALTDEYLLDQNLLFPVEGTPEQSHTFDYMFQTFGNGYETSLTNKDVPREKRVYAGQNWPSDVYFRWPNLQEIYPYIRWDEFHPYLARKSWHVTANEESVHLKTHFLLQKDETMRAMLGMAQLNIRGRYRKDRMLLGVPKICARKEGRSGQFMVLHDAFKEKEHVTAAVRLDERSARVSLADGRTDWVFIEREGDARHLLVRASGGVLQSVSAFELKKVKLGGMALLSADDAAQSIGARVEYAGKSVRVYTTSKEAARLLVHLGAKPSAVTADGKAIPVKMNGEALRLDLPPGVHRAQITMDSPVRISADENELNSLVSKLPLRPVKTEDDRFALDTSKVVWQRVYRRPRIYADGAYKGVDGIDLWSAAISDNAEVAVLGTHENCIECVGKDGSPRWRFYMDGRAVCDYWGKQGHWDGIGLHARPLSISSDGSRIAAVTEKGTVYLLNQDGHLIWKANVKGWGYSATLSRKGDRVAVASEQEWVLYDGDGKVLYRRETEGASGLDAAVSGSGGHFAFTDTKGNLAVVDRGGKELWRWNPAEISGERSAREQAHWFAVPKGKISMSDVRLSADGSKVVVALSNSWLIALNGKGKLLWMRQDFDERLHEAAISDDGRRIAVAGGGGGLHYYDGKGKRLWMHQNSFSAYFTAMSTDGRYVCSVSPTGVYYLISGEGEQVTRTPLLTPEPMVMAITPDGRYTLVAGIGFDAYLFENAVR